MPALGTLSVQISADLRDFNAGAKLTADQILRISTYAESGFGKMQKAADSAATRLSSGVNRALLETTAALEGATRGTAKFVEIEARLKGIDVTPELRAQIDALKQVEAQLKNNSTSNLNHTKSTKELGFALRNVPAQISDIVVSLQGGQKPLTVFLQQGAQLKDLFGGVGPALKGLATGFLNIISPTSLALAGAAVLAAAYAAGANESTRLNIALINTGNIAGTTTGNLTALAGQVGELTGKYGLAREAAEALAGSGIIAGRDIPTALKGIVDGVDVTGKAVKDLTKDFEKLATEPLKGLVELNKTQNFLTVDIYKQVKALEEQGKTQQAATLAQETYANVLASRKNEVVSNLGLFERAWKAIKEESGAALDNLLKIGRVGVPAEQLARADFEIQRLKTGGFRGSGRGSEEQILDAIAARDKLANDFARSAARAAAVGSQRESNKLKIGSLDFRDKKILAANPIERINREYAPHIAAFAAGTKEFIELTAMRDAEIAKINAKAAAPGRRSGNSAALSAENAERKYGIDLLKEQIDAEMLLANEAGEAFAKGLADKAEAQKQYTASLAASLETSYAAAQSEQDRTDAVQRQIDVFGLSEQAVTALEAAKLNDAAATYTQQAAEMARNGVAKETIDYVYGEIDAIKARAKALEQFGVKTTELDNLKEAKKAQEELEKQAKKSAEDTAKYFYDAGKSIWDAFTTKGGNAFKNIKQSAKTILFDWLYDLFAKKWVLNVGVSASGAGVGQVLTDTGSNSIFGQLSSIGDIFTSGNNAIVSGIGSLGQTLSAFGSGGTGILRDIASSVGSFTQLNAGLISRAAPYAGAVLQLAQGNFAGAAFTAIGTALGGPIGGAIGGLVGGLFGKKPKTKEFSSLINSSYSNSEFTSKDVATGKRALGGESQLTDISKAFSTQLGGLLRAFGLSDSVSTSNYLYQRSSTKTRAVGRFGASFDGGSVSALTGKAGSAKDAIAELLESVLGGTLAEAIKKSKLPEGIKSLFEGLTDKTQVSNMINASLSLNEAQDELAARFGLTVDAAGKVSVASDKAGDDLAKFATSIAAAGLSTRSIGTQLVRSGAELYENLNRVFGDVVTEAVVSSVSRQVPIANTATASPNTGLQALLGGGASGFASYGRLPAPNGLAGVLSQFNTPTQQLQTVTEQITTFVERIASRNTQLPRTLADYDSLLKNIDKTSAAGQKMFADVFALRDQFIAFTGAVDGLKGNVRNALFGIVSDAEKQAFLNEDLARLFGGLNITIPNSIQELVNLGRTIDYTTASGLDLAAAFPNLVNAFQETQQATESLVSSFTSKRGFASLVDEMRFSGVAENYGAQFAADYTSNFDAGRIRDGRNVQDGAANEALIEQVKLLRKTLTTLQAIAVSNSKLLGYEDQKAEIADQATLAAA